MFLQDGDNALHTAARNGHYDTIELLLDKYPDMIKQTSDVSEQIIQLVYSNCLVEFTQSHNILLQRWMGKVGHGLKYCA